MESVLKMWRNIACARNSVLGVWVLNVAYVAKIFTPGSANPAEVLCEEICRTKNESWHRRLSTCKPSPIIISSFAYCNV